jgi:hypothetical protein
MIRTVLSVLILAGLVAPALKADPSPNEKSSSRKKKETTRTVPKIVPATPLASGWSYTNGVWTHIDGYKLVNGQVVRSGVQTHKKAPKPPTKAEMDLVMKKKQAPQTPAEAAAAKAAQRERNLTPRPASQTGTHL